MTTTADSVLDEVLSERMRQVQRHGYTAAHDDSYADGALADAAACYAFRAKKVHGGDLICPVLWPWNVRSWKPRAGRRRMLVKAMALLCAEVERIDRAEARRG